MEEITKISLDNEMDLILAHKRSMKLGELAGLSLSAQTGFATGVSEISRIAIASGETALLRLGVDAEKNKAGYLVARIEDHNVGKDYTAALAQARKLATKVNLTRYGGIVTLDLLFACEGCRKTGGSMADEWRNYFAGEPPLSAYDEIRKQNVLLRQLAEQVRERENHYRTLTDGLSLMIVSLSNEGKLTYTNKWFNEYTGLTPYLLNETKWKAVLHPEDYEPFWAKWKDRHRSGNRALKGEYRLKNFLTQEHTWHLISLSPYRDENDTVLYWSGYIVDIHAQKLIQRALKDNEELQDIRNDLQDHQAELEQRISELHRSNYELSHFAYVASHDLQEPLRKLMVYSDYLKKRYSGDFDEKGTTVLNGINSAAGRMQKLILDLLLLSRINPAELKFETVDLNEIAVEVLAGLDVLIQEKSVEIFVDRLPVLSANAGQMRQLFQNLISNAIKYSHSGRKPTLAISSSVHGSSAVITFTDNGIGFEQQHSMKIFELFQRLHTREQYEGTGIGLTISKKIVDLHKGKIESQGVPGEGSVFTVTLPVNQ